MDEKWAAKPVARLRLASGISVFAAKPLVAPLSIIFIVCGMLLARNGAALSATPQLNAHYLYARLAPCRYSASATCRLRPGRRAPAAVQRPPANGAAVTVFGPGSVRLQGSAESLRLEVHDSTIAAVLAAIGRAFYVQYRSSTALDDAITGTYAGPLTHVIARVLDGYDYVIKHEDSAFEVAVFGRSSGRAAPASPAKPAVVAPVRHGRCGRSAGHQAACQPI